MRSGSSGHALAAYDEFPLLLSELFDARVDAPELDEPLRVAEGPIEDRQVAPRRVVSEGADVGVEPGGRALGVEPLRQVAPFSVFA